MTDFENAAFATIMVLLTRTILAFDLDLLVPISQVDENMRRAHARDGVLLSKFFFRKHLVDCNRDVPCGAYCCESEEMSIAEVRAHAGRRRSGAAVCARRSAGGVSRGGSSLPSFLPHARTHAPASAPPAPPSHANPAPRFGPADPQREGHLLPRAAPARRRVCREHPMRRRHAVRRSQSHASPAPSVASPASSSVLTVARPRPHRVPCAVTLPCAAARSGAT
jgi:hypothetical protein